ncbi:MAG: 4Fe-4S ferredoxin [Syntrophus sp. (in: bacteria)]|nr:4Fe-4S ferredoxin [Syntrophus sp. (in: bacteria)]
MRPYIDKSHCTDCGECITLCPYDVFSDTDKNGAVTVLTPEDCIECGACIDACPQEAIFMDD